MATGALGGGQSLQQYWKSLDLPKLQKELDETAADLANRQDESEESRKKLVDLSRAFKQDTPEDVRKQVAPLLKSFQAEVDNLSKRSKSAEAAFLSLYKKLIELPDPVPALEGALQWQKKAQRTKELEIEVKTLQETVDQYNAEFTEVKNQEITIRQLKDKLKHYEENFTALVESQVKEKEEVLARRFAECEQQLQDAGGILSLKLQEADKQASHLQQSLSAAQQELFELKNRSDEHHNARNSEIEMVYADSERANQRAEAMERECELLREQVQALRAATTQIDDVSVSATDLLQVELSAKDKQITQLLADVQQLHSRLSAAERDKMTEIDQLKQQLQERTRSLEELQKSVASQADYSEMKRELSIMKSIEFGSETVEQCDLEQKSLEYLLLEKNKSLQATMTGLKLAKQQADDAKVQPPPLRPSDCPSASPQSSNGLCTPPGPYQRVVNAIGTLVGSELVASYRVQSDADLPLDLDGTQAAHQDTTVDDDSNIKEAQITHAQEVQRAIEKYSDCLDPDVAVRGGVPADIAEALVIENLQKLIHENVQRIGGAPLNTQEIAYKCRQMLSYYNIGQRLFSKCVLNQSQGALSELLSKPKYWDRLTEKGRESFRKIFSWMSDARSITALQALSPKRLYSTAAVGSTPQSKQTVNHLATPSSRSSSECQPSSSVHASLGERTQVPRLSSASLENPFLTKPISLGVNTSRERARSYRYRHDDIPKEMILEIYQKELAKLKAQEECLHKELKPPKEHRDRSAQSSNAQKLGMPFLVKHEPTDSPTGSDTADPYVHNMLADPADESPLQHIQHITNSFVPPSASSNALQGWSNSGVGSSGSSFSQFPASGSTKGLKNVFPPITQEQLERYANIDTDALVYKVKNFLSEYSVSQRLFGEHVLGLSQGSVSDLLARPKPWNMLTQKGREPFIRMSMFLTDPAAVEKLMQARNNPGASYVAPAASNVQENGASVPRNLSMLSMETDSSSHDSFTSQSVSHHAQASAAHAEGPPSPPLTLASHSSIYEMAMHMPPLDTVELTESVKQELVEYNINQRQFGELVLGLSQGSVSELLSKPRPWNVLGARGREPYIRMQMWMNDPNRVEKIHAQKAHNSKTSLKRNAEQISQASSSASLQDYLQAAVGVDSNNESLLGMMSTPWKKPRVVLSDEQKESLLSAFDQDSYPSNSTIQYLAEQLGLSMRTVINWFHNHRMRQKYRQMTSPSEQHEDYAAGSSVDGTPCNWRDQSHDFASAMEDQEDSRSCGTEMINGVCVRQTDVFAERMPAGVIKVEPEDPLEDGGGKSSYEKLKRRLLEKQRRREKLMTRMDSHISFHRDINLDTGLDSAREEALARLQRNVDEYERDGDWEF